MAKLIEYHFQWLLLIGIISASSENHELSRQNVLNHPISNWFETAMHHQSKEHPEIADAISGLLQQINSSPEKKRDIAGFLKLRFLSEKEKISNFPTAFTPANISEQCRNDSLNYYFAHSNLLKTEFQLWALQMYESSGKDPEGFWDDSSYMKQSVGLFDECVAVQAEPFNNTFTGTKIEADFAGQYCSVFFSIAAIFPNQTDSNEGSNKINNGNNSDQDQDQQQERDFWIKWSQIIQFLVGGPSVLEPLESEAGLISPYLPRLDLCIPSSCSYQDLRMAVASLVGNQTFGSFNDTETGQKMYLAFSTQGSAGYCNTREKIETPPAFDGPDIAFITTLSLLGFLVLIDTLHEGLREFRNRPIDLKVESLPARFLNCFSVLNNSRKILSTKVNSTDNFSCLNGIRVLSTTWIVMGHTYYQATSNPIYDGIVLYNEALQWPFHGGVAAATFAVDTFFLMSGLLVAYLLLRELERNKGRFNVALFYLHRYLRLTPVYAVILGFVATLMIYTTYGPKWENINFVSKTACRYNWWNNLLYINNYVKTYSYVCLGETWYLACDMQMFIVSPLFIYPLWRWWKVGISWAIFAIAALQGGLVAIFIIWDLPAATTYATRGIRNSHWYDGYYVQMWTRFPPYLFGIILGWILYLTKGSQLKMNKVVVSVGWVAAFAIGLAVAYGLVPYLDPVTVPEIDTVIQVAYGAFSRLAWSVAVGWVIFVCIKGYGGIVNRFLSWKGFTPLGRLTYVVYLIHFDFLFVYWAHARKPYYYTTLDHILHYFGVLLMVFLLAFFISVTVEAPFLNLEKLLFTATQRKPTHDQPKYTDDDFKIPRLRPTLSAPNIVEKESNYESNPQYDTGKKNTYL